MDRAPFERLALEQLDAVYRMALHLTRNAEEADDLVQDVYARAFRPTAIAGFEDRTAEGTGGMRAWLFTITHNSFYTRVKKQARQPQSVGEFYGQASDELPPGEAPPAWDRASFDWEQVDERLKNEIHRLKPEFREVLMMWGVDGLKYREIATILDVPIGTVMSRLHRARKLLADALTGDEQTASDLGLGVRIADQTGSKTSSKTGTKTSTLNNGDGIGNATRTEGTP